VILALVFVLAGAPEALADAEALALISAMPSRYAAVADYRCRFTKQERVAGKLLPEEEMRMQFMAPFAVRLRWVGRVHRGREALYVRGKNQDRIRARQGGLLRLFSVNLDPTGKSAMKDNRHPLTEIGIGHVVEALGRDLDRARAKGELGLAATAEAGLVRIELSFAGEGYYAPRQRVWIDRGLGLPTRIEVYDGRQDLLERYEYRDLKLNTGLTERDFEP